jgi:hypothetical protein
MIGGTQDNGTELKRADGTWFRASFGDGGYAVIDQNATDTLKNLNGGTFRRPLPSLPS